MNSSSISPGGKKWETRDITTGTSSSIMNKQALGPASNEYATCKYIFRWSDTLLWEATLSELFFLTYEKIFSKWEEFVAKQSKFFSFKIDPFSEGIWQARKQKWSHKIFFPFKNGWKSTNFIYFLKTNGYTSKGDHWLDSTWLPSKSSLLLKADTWALHFFIVRTFHFQMISRCFDFDFDTNATYNLIQMLLMTYY